MNFLINSFSSFAYKCEAPLFKLFLLNLSFSIFDIVFLFLTQSLMVVRGILNSLDKAELL